MTLVLIMKKLQLLGQALKQKVESLGYNLISLQTTNITQKTFITDKYCLLNEITIRKPIEERFV